MDKTGRTDVREIEHRMRKIKMELVLKAPFYGKFLSRLPVIANENIKTARTDGRRIEYSPDYFAGLNDAEARFVVLHELFHVMFLHGARGFGKKDHVLANITCDMVVNETLMRIQNEMEERGIEITPPPNLIFGNFYMGETWENIYERLERRNKKRQGDFSIVWVWVPYYDEETGMMGERMVESDRDIDIGSGEWSEEVVEEIKQMIKERLKEEPSEEKGFGAGRGVRETLLKLVEPKKLPWDVLLREFLTDAISEDASYDSPERKYIHMDRILPGHYRDEEILEEIWAFVDSSGSVRDEELNQFLAQLCSIARRYQCAVNLAYWNTGVTEVYRNIRNPKSILACRPHSSGGTDANCIYNWLAANRIKPDCMLILTDGEFDDVTTPAFTRALSRKTIVVSTGPREHPNMGRLARL